MSALVVNPSGSGLFTTAIPPLSRHCEGHLKASHDPHNVVTVSVLTDAHLVQFVIYDPRCMCDVGCAYRISCVYATALVFSVTCLSRVPTIPATPFGALRLWVLT